MSNSVDKRIVEMQFDNEKFKSGAKDTMKALQDLDNSLNSDRSGISKNLDFIADKFTALGTIGRRALENITDSIMSTGKNLFNQFAVAPRTEGFNEYELKMSSMQTIVNSVIDKFESEADAVEYVGEKLDALNKYADKTKYNFAQATSSIGKFTNAGIDLDTSVNSIQGIMNLAASAGQGAEQANSAMYNFAQALGVGYLGLIDWKSIENANLATMEFKNELIRAGEAAGTLVKVGNKWKSITTNNRGEVSDEFDATNLRETLNYQWVTADVLTKALSNYADETTDVGKKATEAATRIYKFTEMMDALQETAGSGWAKTWELIFGDFTESTNLWTAVYKSFNDILDKQAESRNKLLETWRTSYGGAQQMQTAVQNILDGIAGFLKQIKDAWTAVFPPATAEQLQKFGEGIVGLTERFKKAGEQGTFLKNVVTVIARVFKVFASAFKIAAEVVKGIVKVLSPVGKLLKAIFDRINNFLGGTFFAFKDGSKSVDLVTKITDGIAAAFDFLAKHMDKAVDWIIGSMESGVAVFSKGLNIGTKIKAFFSNIKSSITKGFTDMGGLQGLTGKLSEIWVKIKNAFSGGFAGLISSIKNIASQMKEYNIGTLLDALNFGAIVVLTLKIKSAIGDFKDMIKSFKNIAEGLTDVLKNVSKVLGSFSKVLKAKANDLNATAFLKVAAGLAILAASLIALTFVDHDALMSAASVIGVFGIVIMAIVGLMTKANGTGQWFDQLAHGFNVLAESLSMAALGVGLLTIAASMAALLGIILLYSKIDWMVLLDGIGKMATAFVIFGGWLTVFSYVAKGCTPVLIALSVAFVTISASMIVLAGVIGLFSLIISENAGAAWAGFGMLIATFEVMLWSLIGAMAALSKIPVDSIKVLTTGMLKLSVAMIAMAVAMNLLVPALALFTLLANHGGWDGFWLLAATLVAVSVALIALGGAVRLMGQSGKYLGKIAVGIGILALSFVGIALLAPMIIANADKIKEALFILVNTVCDVLITSAPKIVSAIFTLLNQILTQINNNLPALVVKILNIVTGILTGIANYTPAITQQVYRIVKGVIDTVIEMLKADTPNQGTIYGILAGVVGLTILIKKMADVSAYLKNAAKTLGFMAIMMVGIVGLFWVINKLGIGGDATVEQATAIGVVMVALAIAMQAMSKIQSGGASLDSVGSTLINMAIFVAAAFGIMQLFRTIQDLDGKKMVPQAIAIGLVIAALGFAMGQLKNVGGLKEGGGIALAALPFVGMVVALMFAFRELEGIEPTKMIGQAIAIGLVLVAMGFAASMANKYETSIGRAGGIAIQLGAMLLVVVALGIIFSVLRDVGFQDSQSMIAMAISMGIVIVAMGAAAMLANKSSTNFKKAAGVAIELGALAVGLVAVAFALWLLKDADPDKVIVDAIALSALLLVLAGCVKILSTIKANQVGKAKDRAKLIGETMILLLGAGGVIWALSNFTKEGVNALTLITQAGGIALILLALAACVKILGSIDPKDTGVAKDRAKLIGEAMILLLGAGGAVFALSQFTKEGVNALTLITQAGAVAVLLLVLAACVKILGSIDPKDTGTAADRAKLIGEAIVLLLGAGGAVWALSQFSDQVEKPWSLVATAGAVAIILLALGASAWIMAAIAKVPLDPATASTAAGVIAGVGIVLAAIIALIGTIALAIDESGIQDYAEYTTSDIFNKGFEVIGSVIGNIGANIVGSYEANKSAWDKMKSENLAEATSQLLNVTADTVERVNGIDAGSFKTKALQLVEAIKDFMTSVSDSINITVPDAGSIAAENLSLVMTFVDSLIDKSLRAKGANADAINSLASLMKAISELGKALVNSAAYVTNLQNLMKPIEGYDNSFDALGAGVMDFYEQTKGLDGSVVDRAANASKAISSLSESVKNMTSMGSTQNDIISSFVTNLPSLGTAVAKYCHAVQNIELDKVKDGIEATKAILEFYKTMFALNASGIDPVGSIVSTVMHNIRVKGKYDSDFAIIIDGLERFEGNMEKLAKSLTLLSTVEVTTGMTNLKDLVELWETLNEVARNDRSYNFEDTFSDLAHSGVDSFIKVFEDAADRVRVAVQNMKGAAIAEANRSDLTTGMNGQTIFADQMIGKFLSGEITSSDLNSMMASGDIDPAYFQKFIQNMYDVNGVRIKFGYTFDPNSANAEAQLDSIFKNLEGKVDTDSYKLGTFFQEGTANGISDNQWVLNLVSYESITEAIGCMFKAADSNSPSKKTYELGKWIVLGYVNAIKDYSNRTSGSIKDFVSNTISTISAVFDDVENREWKPSITPVMNLDDVQNGVRQMDNTLNGISTTMGFNKANGVAVSMNGAVDNAKLAGEVSNLSSKVEGLQEALIAGDLGDGVASMVSEMTGLRGDIDSMMGSMSNLKVVMNGDNLVGQIIGKIDSALGKRARLAARR